MAEGARLESVCTVIPYRGFESRLLRQSYGKPKVLNPSSSCSNAFLQYQFGQFQILRISHFKVVGITHHQFG